ncbi:F0F1 ATP synthase subunit B family protein [Brevundimonas sp.]|uniref:F0F1 ATP synthase subunit B family protein n=1 Tax=Brevundimonas sp. TaxID=1871086 RepID=UPI002FCA65C1
MTTTAHPVLPADAAHPVAIEDTHATTEAAHGGEHESGGLPQFEFQHWFGQIVYLIFLFAILYFLIAKVFAPRLRRVFDEREQTIATAIATARQVQSEAAGQAEAAKAEVEAARASSRATAAAAKARVADEANARAAAEEAVVNARIAEAETAIGKTRDAAMTNVAAIASDTAAAIVERLTGKSPTAAEAAAAVKGAA